MTTIPNYHRCETFVGSTFVAERYRQGRIDDADARFSYSYFTHSDDGGVFDGLGVHVSRHLDPERITARRFDGAGREVVSVDLGRTDVLMSVDQAAALRDRLNEVL